MRERKRLKEHDRRRFDNLRWRVRLKSWIKGEDDRNQSTRALGDTTGSRTCVRAIGRRSVGTTGHGGTERD